MTRGAYLKKMAGLIIGIPLAGLACVKAVSRPEPQRPGFMATFPLDYDPAAISHFKMVRNSDWHRVHEK